MAGRSRMLRGRKRKRGTISSSDEENDTDHTNNNNNNNNNNNSSGTDEETESEEPQKKEKWSEFMKQHTKLAKDIRKTRKKTKIKWLRDQAMDRRDCRIALRDLDNNIDNDMEALKDPLNHKLLEYTKIQNEINSLISHPLEASHECEISRKLTEVVYEQAKTLSKEQMTINTNDFINGLKNNYTNLEDDSLDLFKLSDDVCDIISFLPSISFLSGILTNDLLETNDELLSNQKKKKRNKPRLRQRFEPTIETVNPTQITEEIEQNKNETKKRVINVKKQIRHLTNYHIDKQQNGINLMKTLHDSNSFSKTIENWFDYAFLIQQGKCSTFIDDNTQQPMINYVPTAVKQRQIELFKEEHGHGLPTSQSIVKMDQITWQNISNCYDLIGKESQIIDKYNIPNNESDDDMCNNLDENDKNVNNNNNDNNKPKRRKRRRY